jgi:hypothetical protein
MVLDAFSVRVALGVVTVTLLVLFCTSFHRTRSPYAGWWSLALLEFMVGNAAFLLNGSPHQQWANPLGNVLVVAGAFSVWAGARTLRDLTSVPWQLAVGPAVTALASILENPGTNVWSGGLVYLAMMTAGIALAAKDLWFIKASHSQVHKALSLAAGLLAAYYLGRWVVYVLEGPASHTFRTYFGPGPSGLVSMVLLVTVSFSMTALTSDQLIKGLKERAARDHLTGLLNRGTFLELATTELNRLHSTGSGAAVVLADLDHFKAVNDEYGHGAGDAALQGVRGGLRRLGEVNRSHRTLWRRGIHPLPAWSHTGPGRKHRNRNQPPHGSHAGAGGRLFPTISYGVTSSIPGRSWI